MSTSGLDFLESLGGLLQPLRFARKGSRCAVITDDRVAPLYAESVLASLRAAEWIPTLISVPAGEASKSMDEVARVADRLIETGLDRHGFVVALGGGVVGDLAGFVSAIYLPRRSFRPDSHDHRVAGGQRHRRQNGRQHFGGEKPVGSVLSAVAGARGHRNAGDFAGSGVQRGFCGGHQARGDPGRGTPGTAWPISSARIRML